MTAPTSPQPAPPRRTEATLDLDARILQAEQRLIARETNLRRRANSLSARVRATWQPQRLLPLLAGAGLALVGLKWLGRGGHAATPRAEGPPSRAHAGGPHWVSLLGVLWPLLPLRWRARVPPSVVNLATGVGLPLLETLLQRRPPPPLATAAPLDPALLAGGWYEVARLPPRRGGGPPHWQHSFDDSGALLMDEARDDAADGPRRGVRAVATVLPDSGCARWRVSDWPWLLQLLPGAWHELAVLHVDETELVLGSPERDRLRLLSRSPALAPGRLEALLALAHERGFDLERLQFVDRP